MQISSILSSVPFSSVILAREFLQPVFTLKLYENLSLTRCADASKRGLIPLIVSKITSKLRGLLSRSKPLLIFAVVLAVLFHYIVN